MRIATMLVKVLLVLAAMVLCALLARRIGPWRSLIGWTAGMAVLCAGIALAVRMQAPGKVTGLNYLMGYILPWGYRVAKGQLPGIVLISWVIWALLGAAGILAARTYAGLNAPDALATTTQVQARSLVILSLLAIAWVIDGAALLYLLRVVMVPGGARQLGLLAPVMAILLLMIVASVALVTLRHSATAAHIALAIAGGPPLLLGLLYGAFVVVIVLSGRNARWN